MNMTNAEVEDKIHRNTQREKAWLILQRQKERAFKKYMSKYSVDERYHNADYDNFLALRHTIIGDKMEKLAQRNKNRVMLENAVEPTEDDWGAFAEWLNEQFSKCNPV